MADIGKDISRAKELLEQGKLVAIPTETVYGLAGNALNIDAVTSIFKTKDRPHFDPLIVHVPDVASAANYVLTIPAKAEKLASLLWPGPLTLLLNKKEIIPDLVTSGLDRVGIRCPDHSLTRELLKALSFPLAAPSANPFGYVSPTTPAHVNEQLGDKIEYILDGGECKIGIESTIVGFEDEQSFVYRMGGLSIETIEEAIGNVVIQLNTSSNPKAPGQLKSHYAPRKRLVLGNITTLLKTFGPYHVGILAFQDKRKEVADANQYVLSPDGNVDEAAQHLFSALRELDKMPVQVILAEEAPERGLGRAINDRLRRAAG